MLVNACWRKPRWSLSNVTACSPITAILRFSTKAQSRYEWTQGYCLEDAGIAQRQTAADYLKELEKIKVLRRLKVGKEVLYLNTRLYNLLSR
jgi:hypothetical protein